MAESTSRRTRYGRGIGYGRGVGYGRGTHAPRATEPFSPDVRATLLLPWTTTGEPRAARSG
eukprot:6839164-Prymnesium_polylepis.4